jgi:hypothetical protein
LSRKIGDNDRRGRATLESNIYMYFIYFLFFFFFFFLHPTPLSCLSCMGTHKRAQISSTRLHTHSHIFPSVPLYFIHKLLRNTGLGSVLSLLPDFSSFSFLSFCFLFLLCFINCTGEICRKNGRMYEYKTHDYDQNSLSCITYVERLLFESHLVVFLPSDLARVSP